MRMTLKGILVGVVLLAAAWRVFAYPPDNAAVLYYKAFLIMEEPNAADVNLLRQLRKGEIGVNDRIRHLLESNRKAIKEIVTAAQIKNCDWGLNYSEGLSTCMPHLGKFRSCAYLLAADGAFFVEKGDYKTAMERWLALCEMNRHMGDNTLIERLVGTACGGMAFDYIRGVLPKISGDSELLQWLKTRLTDVSGRYPSMGAAVGKEAGVWSNSINREGILELVNHSELSKGDIDRVERVIRQNDNNEFCARVTEYYKGITSRMQIAYDLPYPQAKQKLDDMCGEVKKTAKEKPEAVITEVLLPAINRVLTIDTRGKTHLNAVLAGIDIYLIRAKTGKLPDELPAGLPKDLFSGKDFIYEKTDAGFTLTGQGKDIDKDIVQKYEFKVAK